MHRRSLWLGVAVAGVLALRCSAADAARGMVATVHPLATEAGLEALRRGGNAVDAAVAAALTLGVVDSHNSGLGGGCFFLLQRPDGEIVALDGRETAPAAATRDLFVRDGRAVPELSQTGGLAVGVPGEVAALHLALTRYGRLEWGDHCRAAARVAEAGFEVTPSYSRRLASVTNELQRFPAARAVFLRPAGEPWLPGETLRQPELAASLRALAAEGPAWFYRGAFARATAAWMRANGGSLTEADLAAYVPRQREPIRTTYRGCEIIGFPPPSSGGVHVAQILNLLERFDLRALDPHSADFVHLVAEAMKLAFADRAHWLGDPDFVPVPRGLVAREYADELARKIDRHRATAIQGAGSPPRAQADVFGKHTTHLSTADAAGNWVACTATLNTTFGSKVVVPGTGVVLNNQMDDFVAQPGATNFYRLVGAEANAIAPGKRPLSSMAPTIVRRDGRPILSVGAAGGPTIISQTVLAIIQVVDYGCSPAEALARPRFHHQWRPDELEIEQRFPEATKLELKRRGHTLREVESLGACQAVGRTPDQAAFCGAHDPRVSEGRAAGW